MNALDDFKKQLADELLDHATSLPPMPGGRRMRPRPATHRIALTFALATAAAAAVVALPLSAPTHGPGQAAPTPRGSAYSAAPSTTPRPSHSTDFGGLDIVTADYAVRSRPGGVVTVQLFTLKGQAGLQATLNRAGIPAAVMVASPACHATGPAPKSTGKDTLRRLLKVLPPPTPGSYDSSHGIRDIHPAAMAPGDHLLFIAPAEGTPLNYLVVRLVRQLPSCIASTLQPVY
ncbi:hypothetical protein [Streptacidiphilus cavernicola]|uniref:Uncharacterized protein n=1 Tax=Streptacidiphilus cavernicola TaxID=3342716 RepID=A0ABV6VWG7_9ACTN